VNPELGVRAEQGLVVERLVIGRTAATHSFSKGIYADGGRRAAFYRCRGSTLDTAAEFRRRVIVKTKQKRVFKMKRIVMAGIIVCTGVYARAEIVFEETFYVGGTRVAGPLNGMTVGSTAAGLYDSGYIWSATGKMYMSGTGEAGYLRYWGGVADAGIPGIATVNFSAFDRYDALTLIVRGADIEGPVMRCMWSSTPTARSSWSKGMTVCRRMFRIWEWSIQPCLRTTKW
jgi:hypothetical protein